MVIGLHAELGRGITMNDDFEFFNERLFYDEKTGIFYWRDVDIVGGKARGKQAGTVNSKGYIIINVKKDGKQSQFRAHRLAWLFVNGHFPEIGIDHINGDKLDNRMENLREASILENGQNRRKASSHNKLGVLGVRVDKYGKYIASIRVNGKVKFIGRFNEIAKASDAYIQAKRELHSFCTI